jgi:DNA-binding transcriptional regulator YhcF (GntR family)
MIDEVSEILDEDRRTSTRRMSVQLNISQASVQRIYKKMGGSQYGVIFGMKD